MTSLYPYRLVFGINPLVRKSLLSAFDDMMDFSESTIASKAFPLDVEDQGEAYEVTAYLTGVSKENIDIELNEGRLSISVRVEESEEDKNKNYLQREFGAYAATRGVYLKDASSEGLSARYADGVLRVSVPKFVEKQSVTKVVID
ncbi:Hsp20 family protein [Collinsella sp. zg1085]|uniref:Hsp20 family protein n=1 Tax=Collinsella sp. zg1085 TaxID=2844380 RepID=UPI001C0C8B7E|nr:Hsp20 family protein [Collinsella sp. zg1085]QWT17756.1 Hsp20 family protein [Collinsella sp. zg1085]